MKISRKHVLKQAPLKKAVAIDRVKEPINKNTAKTESKGAKNKTIVYSFIGLFIGVGLLLLISLKFSFIKVHLAGIEIDNNADRQQLIASLENQTKDFQITVSVNDKTNNYKIEKAGILAEIPSSVDEALKTKKPTNHFKRLAFWQKHELGLKLTADQKKLEKFIDIQLTKTIKKASNATVAIDNGSSKIVAEKDGLVYSLDDPQATLMAHVANLDNRPITLQKTAKPAKITLAEAEKAKKTIDAILNKPVSFNIVGSTVNALPSDIGQWIEIHPVPSDKTIDITISGGKILDYLNAIAAPYVTPPQNAILVPGSNSKILIPGINGVDIVDKETVAANVARQILKQDSVNQNLSVAYQTYKTITATPHDKWIAVDLSSKVLYAYEKTQLVRTFLISAGAPETPTVEGTFAINSKLVSQDMAGPNADGSRFFQPDVPYVNYFYADYAIHGVYWRPDSYLGSINASHGCVGMNVSESAWLFNWAPIGTTVITFS